MHEAVDRAGQNIDKHMHNDAEIFSYHPQTLAILAIGETWWRVRPVVSNMEIQPCSKTTT